MTLGSAKRRDVPTFLRKLWALEEALSGAGFPAMPPWWRETISRFYMAGKRRLVVRKGRRVFASTCIAPRLAVAEMLWGEHPHLHGTPPLVFAFLSVRRDEAAKRLRGVKAILDALGEKYAERGESVELIERPAIFNVVTANNKANVGDTVAFAWLDEVSSWSDDDLGANPAEQVVGRLAPALATLPDAKICLVSSPLSVNDYHARQFDLGDTPGQFVARGATWEINPHLSEADTRELEPDERTWRREYGAEPSESVEENWFGAAIDKAIDDEPAGNIPLGVRRIISIDPAFDGDSSPDLFGWSVVTSEPGPLVGATGRPRRITRVRAVGAWKPDRSPYGMAERVRDEVCSVFDPQPDYWRIVYTDQHEGHSFSELAENAGLSLLVVPWTGGDSNKSKLARFRSVRLAMLDGSLKIPNDPDLIREFRSVRGLLAPSGVERIEMPRTSRGHCDRVAAVVLGASVALGYGPTPAKKPVPVPGSAEHARLEAEETKARIRAEVRRRAGRISFHQAAQKFRV
ncbi:MAG TPA: hypothetical protein VJV79_36490 [Polyangiaceae bacterium]|nr:hypothetical protein [Polyangiaceae bacterium]